MAASTRLSARVRPLLALARNDCSVEEAFETLVF
jgi:hypothetical protein